MRLLKHALLCRPSIPVFLSLTHYASLYFLILHFPEPPQVLESPEIVVPAATPAVQPINGWVPKEGYYLWGLPGAIAPTGYFDPLGFCRENLPVNDAKRMREAEVQHGRVAMLACVGYLSGEAISGPFGITGPANDQLQQVPLPAFAFLTVAIAAMELYRAKVGWVEPKIGEGFLGIGK